ncbi:MAG: hypothetical protein ACYCSF_11825 [Acidimicrobiales bacterium]
MSPVPTATHVLADEQEMAPTPGVRTVLGDIVQVLVAGSVVVKAKAPESREVPTARQVKPELHATPVIAAEPVPEASVKSAPPSDVSAESLPFP